MSSVAEVWRPVVGHETTYEVSSLGRVRSFDRFVTCRNGAVKHLRGRVTHGSTHKTLGYVIASIAGKRRYVHQLVLEAFVGPRPPRHEACHCNGKRDDNRVENLRWDTPQSNQMDRAKHGTSNRGSRCGTSRLTELQAIEILRSKEPGCVLARRYGISQQGINGIRKGRTWRHLGISPETEYAKADSWKTRRQHKQEAVA